MTDILVALVDTFHIWQRPAVVALGGILVLALLVVWEGRPQ